MGETCIVCAAFIKDMSKATIIRGVGYVCSEECNTKYEEAETARTAEATKESVRKTIQTEIIPALNMASELVAEHKGEIIAAALPLLETYRDLAKIAVEEVVSINVESIVQAVEELKAKGFTQEEAITIVKR